MRIQFLGGIEPNKPVDRSHLPEEAQQLLAECDRLAERYDDLDLYCLYSRPWDEERNRLIETIAKKAGQARIIASRRHHDKG